MIITTEVKSIMDDLYRNFLIEFVKNVFNHEGMKDVTKVITLDELWTVFRKWYRDKELKSNIPCKIDFKKNTERLCGPADKEDKWYGFYVK